MLQILFFVKEEENSTFFFNFAMMLHYIRKANLFSAFLLLIVLCTISGKEIMHSFIWHSAVHCENHATQLANSDVENIAEAQGKHCLFCQIDFSTFHGYDTFFTEYSDFNHTLFSTQPQNTPFIEFVSGEILLRGPPVFV